MDGANGMPSQGLNIGYQMDQLDPKQLGFVIYLVLRMHQFQKYHLLSQFLFFKKKRKRWSPNLITESWSIKMDSLRRSVWLTLQSQQLIKAETPKIIANMACLEAKRKALVLLRHQRENANQQKFFVILFLYVFRTRIKECNNYHPTNVLSLFLSTMYKKLVSQFQGFIIFDLFLVNRSGDPL